jgi:hypothetical protein
MLRLQPGDIFLTKGDSFVSRGIRFLSRSGGEARTEANHTGLVVAGGSRDSAVIVEALTKVVRRRMSSYSQSRDTGVAIYRPLNVSPDQIETIVARAEQYVGDSYGYFKIAAHFGDWCLGGRYFFRRIVSMDKYPICSWVVAQSFADAGLNFGVPAGMADPDDIMDFCASNLDKYEVIHAMAPMRTT